MGPTRIEGRCVAGAGMEAEFHADRCPQEDGLTGNHRKLTTEETIALFAPREETGQ